MDPSFRVLGSVAYTSGMTINLLRFDNIVTLTPLGSVSAVLGKSSFFTIKVAIA